MTPCPRCGGECVVVILTEDGEETMDFCPTCKGEGRLIEGDEEEKIERSPMRTPLSER